MNRAAVDSTLVLLALWGCQDPDAAMVVDQGALDGAVADVAVQDHAVTDQRVVDAAPPDAADPCAAPNPAAHACRHDTDCPAGLVCEMDPAIGVSARCECTADGWFCLEETIPSTGCFPAQRPCAGPLDCRPGEACEDGVCAWRGEPCAHHYDCDDSACDFEVGRCLRPCPDEPMGEARCQALPPQCPAGWTSVTTEGCWACRDPRSECANRSTVGHCAGRLPEGGQCLAARLTGELTACERDGAALHVLTFTASHPCDVAAPVELAVHLPGPIDLTHEAQIGAPGVTAWHCAAGECVAAQAGTVQVGPAPEADRGGRLWLSFPTGVEVDANYELYTCAEPTGRCPE